MDLELKLNWIFQCLCLFLHVFQVLAEAHYLLSHACFQQHHHTGLYRQSNLPVTALKVLLKCCAKSWLLHPCIWTEREREQEKSSQINNWQLDHKQNENIQQALQQSYTIYPEP